MLSQHDDINNNLLLILLRCFLKFSVNLKIMFTNKNLFSNACKLVLFAVLLSTLFSCSEWENEYDFRNYIRDKHPFCEIKETNLGYFTYQVNDTINNKIYIYKSGKSKSSTIVHCVNCK